MLNDKQQAEVHKLITESVSLIGDMITGSESGFTSEDWDISKKMGLKLEKSLKILDP
jgi:hypothetical protein